MSSVDYPVLGQLAPADTNVASLLTVDTGLRVVTSSLTIANIGSVVAAYDIAIRPAGASLVNKHYIAKNVNLGVGNFDSITIGLTLPATCVVSVRSSVADTLAFNIFGVEITP